MYFYSKYILCRNNSQLPCPNHCRHLWFSSNETIIYDVEWGGMLGIYSSEGKSRQKARIPPNGDYSFTWSHLDLSWPRNMIEYDTTQNLHPAVNCYSFIYNVLFCFSLFLWTGDKSEPRRMCPRGHVQMYRSPQSGDRQQRSGVCNITQRTPRNVSVSQPFCTCGKPILTCGTARYGTAHKPHNHTHSSEV